MKLKVNITTGDFLRMQMRSLFRFPSIAIIGVVLVLIAVSNLDVFQKYGALVFTCFIVLFILCFLAVSIVMQLVITFIMLKLRDQKSFICDHDFEFEEAWFIERTEYNESRYPWTAVSKYYSTKDIFTSTCRHPRCTSFRNAPWRTARRENWTGFLKKKPANERDGTFSNSPGSKPYRQ